MQINSSSYPSCSSCVHFDQDGVYGKCRKKTYRDWSGAGSPLMQCSIVRATDPACEFYRAMGQQSLPLGPDDQLIRAMVERGQEFTVIQSKLRSREDLFTKHYDCNLKSGGGCYGA